MNRSIIRLFGVVILLFTVLIVWTSRWTVFSATALNHNSLNRLSYYASLKIKRGQILADDGAVLAKSLRASGGTWKREYPEGPLFSQAVGYYLPQTLGSTGIEAARNDALQGPKSVLTSVFGSFNGTPKVGDDVHTTLDPHAQELAKSLLAGRVGSVVAMVPQTGAVKVMYSNPSYDDNDPKAPCVPAGSACLINYATQARFPPGSTFKLVTTAAALDTGKYTPDSVINGHGPIMVSGHPLQNDSGEEYGDVTLRDALTNSINVVYAQVGEALGADVMQKYMERFGFYAYPPMDYPANQMVRSGELFYPGKCRNNKNFLLLPVTDPCVDLGRTAIGQANLAVTPLQMAMVVSAIANKGTLMQPRLTSKVVNQEGQIVQTISPQEDDQVMKPKVASEMSGMMRDVVEEGTGQSADLEGQTIAGKTGTASIFGTKDGQPLDDAWFVGFAPVADPKIAVAVELTSIPNGYGGQYAAPIAAQVIQTLLAEGQ
jgi:penicillin-binding protein A